MVQAISVPSEQMFSVAKFTINPTRNHLVTEEVSATPYLKTWFAGGLIKKEFMKDDNYFKLGLLNSFIKKVSFGTYFKNIFNNKKNFFNY